jgi:hypothetical protein
VVRRSHLTCRIRTKCLKHLRVNVNRGISTRESKRYTIQAHNTDMLVHRTNKTIFTSGLAFTRGPAAAGRCPFSRTRTGSVTRTSAVRVGAINGRGVVTLTVTRIVRRITGERHRSDLARSTFHRRVHRNRYVLISCLFRTDVAWSGSRQRQSVGSHLWPMTHSNSRKSTKRKIRKISILKS